MRLGPVMPPDHLQGDLAGHVSDWKCAILYQGSRGVTFAKTPYEAIDGPKCLRQQIVERREYCSDYARLSRSQVKLLQVPLLDGGRISW